MPKLLDVHLAAAVAVFAVELDHEPPDVRRGFTHPDQMSSVVGAQKGSPGIGVYLAGVGALLMIIGGLELTRRRAPRAESAASGDGDPTAEGDTKTCPECAESVKAAARVCRYCGYRFDSETSTAPP